MLCQTMDDDFRILTADEIDSVSGGDDVDYEFVVTAPRYTPPPGYTVAPGDVTMETTYTGDTWKNSVTANGGVASMTDELTKQTVTNKVTQTIGAGTVYNKSTGDIYPGTYNAPRKALD